jgi:hypothetical protein
MAVESGFGGVDITTSYTDNFVYSDGISLPRGREMANGSRACYITHVRGYIAGRGASRNYRLRLGDNYTDTYSVGSAGSAVSTGWRQLQDPFKAEGGSTRFSEYFSGSSYFGRANDGNGFDSYGARFGTLGGGYLYNQAPTAPNFVGVSDTGQSGTLRTDFRGSEDDGGTGISTYRLDWSPSSTFSSNVDTMMTSSGQVNVTGLTPGTRYYFRAAARNAVTDAQNTTSLWSRTVSGVAGGVPSAPRSLTARNSTTEYNTVTLSWTPPASTAGGITGYDIWNGTDKFDSTNGTGTTYIARYRPSNAEQSFFVRARNSYGDATGDRSAPSNIVDLTTTGPPSRPTLVSAVASGTQAGQAIVTWQAPQFPGTGVTKYTVYSSTGAVLRDNISPTLRQATVTGLTPGKYYAFYVGAWNTISQAVGESADSNTLGLTALGAPNAPTNVTVAPSALVPNRLTVSWSMSGDYTGFNVYEMVAGASVFVGTVKSTSIKLDNLTNTSHVYQISARNVVTDTTNPPSEGPRSGSASGIPGTSATQVLAGLAVPNQTNAIFNGSGTIVSITATGVSYARTDAADLPLALVPANAGTVTDTSNSALSVGGTIVSIPSTTSFTMSVPGLADIPADTAVFNGTVVDTTNQVFQTTVGSPGVVSAVDNANRTVSYARTGANVSSRSSGGVVINRSNTVYNSTNVTLTAVTATTLSFAKSNGNLAETGATGSVINVTNRDVYNSLPAGSGAVMVIDTPSYNTFTVRKTAANRTTTAVLSNFGAAYRSDSKAVLNVKYRSGWAG